MLKLSRVLRSLACLLILIVGLAGCGGGGQRPVAKNAVGGSAVNQFQRCTSRSTTLACQVAKHDPQHKSKVGTAPPARLAPGLSFTPQRGVDFAWSCPDPTWNYGGAPVQFAVSYLSPDASKNWSKGCIDWWLSKGKRVGLVWESSADRATQGFQAGWDDADQAANQAAYLLPGASVKVEFAIDCDCSVGQTAGYFQGVDNRLHGTSITADYGGFYPTRGLFDAGLIAGGWQAYAWSYGQWDPRACLEQWLNGDAWDYDRTICANDGLYPALGPPPPPPGPSPAQVRGWVAARGSSLHAYYAHGCRAPVLTSGTCGQLAWRVDHFQKLTDTAHGYYPRCFGARRNLGAAECRIARPAVAVWSRASASSNRWGNYRVARYFDRRIARTLGTSRL